MQNFTKYAGVILIILGTLAFIATRLTPVTTDNTGLLTGLLLIVAGIITHVQIIKHDSRY